MKWIEYDYVCNAGREINLHKKVEYNEVNLAIAEKEAIGGNYAIVEDDEEIAVKPLPIELGGTGANTAGEALANLGGVSMKTVAVTLPVSGWSNKTQTVNVAGVPAKVEGNAIIPTPDSASHDAYHECVVKCSKQSDGKLSFVCSDVPTVALTVNVLILTKGAA